MRATAGRLLLIETSSQESYGATIRFYEKSGYPLVARIKGFYRPGDDKLIFAKELGAGDSLAAPDPGPPPPTSTTPIAPSGRSRA